MNRLLAGLAPRQLLPTTLHVTSTATECMSLASGMEFCTEFDMIETAIDKNWCHQWNHPLLLSHSLQVVLPVYNIKCNVICNTSETSNSQLSYFKSLDRSQGHISIKPGISVKRLDPERGQL